MDLKLNGKTALVTAAYVNFSVGTIWNTWAIMLGVGQSAKPAE